MHFVSFHIDSAEWPCGTKVFTLAASYASFAVHSRHAQLATVGSSVIHQLDSARRAMTRTGVTRVAFAHTDAVLLYPHGVTYMYCSLFLFRNPLDGAGRTDLGATRALRTAVTVLERHLRLHEAQGVGRRTKHLVGTGVDTELAGRTMPVQMPYGYRARRSNRPPSTLIFAWAKAAEATTSPAPANMARRLSSGWPVFADC